MKRLGWDLVVGIVLVAILVAALVLLWVLPSSSSTQCPVGSLSGGVQPTFNVERHQRGQCDG